MGILYHISVDDRFKSMFAYTDCIPQVRLANVRLPGATHGISIGGLTAPELCMRGKGVGVVERYICT